jgi:phospholipase/carboxylesterase
VRLSRRGLLRAALVAGAWACDAGNPPPHRAPSVGTPSAAPSPTPAAPAAAPPPLTAGGLQLVRLGPMSEGETGGQLVVLLHGWGAPGDDLVSLARELARPRTRFLVPAAPLPERGGGRAWWHIDTGRPAKVDTDELPAAFQPSAQVAASRRALQELLREAVQRYAPESVAVAGFSQGAQLALDLALAADPRVDRVGVLSGALLADSLAALHAAKPPWPAVFVSHGQTDRVLPFSGGKSIETLLARRGYPVTFFPFPGGHAIPPEVVAALGRFLAGGAG